MKSIEYYLVKASELKLGGYTDINYSFIYDLIDLVCSEQPQFKQRMIAKFKSSEKSRLEFESRVSGKVPDSTSVPFVWLSGNFLTYPRSIQVDSSISSTLKKLYNHALVNDAYNELCFLLFFLGIVDPLDYLYYITDVNYVASKLPRTRSKNGFNNLVISNSAYIRLLVLYLVNCTRGVDYGFSPYDFIYQMSVAKGGRKKSCAEIFRLLQKQQYFNVGLLPLDSDTVKMYPVEIGLMLPVLMAYKAVSNDKVVEVLTVLASDARGQDLTLLNLVLSHSVILENSGIMSRIS